MIASLGIRRVTFGASKVNATRFFRTVAPSFNAHGHGDSGNTSAFDKLKPSSDPLLGGYPEVEPQLYFDRDPYAKYDDQQNRRNFDQPLNADDDMLNMWSPDYYQPVSDATALKYSAVFFGGIAAFAGFLYVFFYPEKPAVPRNYPHGGLAKALGATDESDAALHAARIDKTA